MRFEGVFVASATPFNHDGHIDYPSFERHLEYLEKSGVHGFVPCATTGEGPTLSREERRNLIGVCLKFASRKKLSVIPGCGGNCTPNVIELCKEAKDLGCHAALVVTPYYNKPTPEGLFAHYTSISSEARFPILLYNVPSRTGVKLSPELVLNLFKDPNIVGIKEAGGDYGQWLALSLKANLTEKALLSGDDDCFAFLMALGGSGIISASANVLPKLFVSIYDCFKQGNWARGFELQKQFFPFKQAFFRETNPAPIKHALSLMGFCEDRLRLPLVPVTADTQKEIRTILNTLEQKL